MKIIHVLAVWSENLRNEELYDVGYAATEEVRDKLVEEHQEKLHHNERKDYTYRFKDIEVREA